MNTRRAQRQQGQGLIESLVIVLLVAIGVVAILNFQHYLSYSTNTTQQQSDAITLANSQIETLSDFQVLKNTSGYTSYEGIVSGSRNATVGNTTFTINWTVTTNTNPNYKTVNVTVSWTDRYSGAQSINLVSDIAGVDPGMPASFMSSSS
jgi:Tfp pilus assembly protein PilV